MPRRGAVCLVTAIIEIIEIIEIMGITALLAFAGPDPVFALGLADISSSDASGGVREALLQGAANAVGKLGKTDGFLKNDKVKIPLPESLQKIEGTLRKVGLGKQADELVVAMNRAAESAVPEAKTLLQDAARKMTVDDAKAILTGGASSATRYFRKATEKPLGKKFLPIVRKTTQKVSLAAKYDGIAGKAAQLGLVDEKDANLEEYVTRKTLDGLYKMIADEERAIRKNPAGQASTLLKKVFGAVRGK